MTKESWAEKLKHFRKNQAEDYAKAILSEPARPGIWTLAVPDGFLPFAPEEVATAASFSR